MLHTEVQILNVFFSESKYSTGKIQYCTISTVQNFLADTFWTEANSTP